MRRRRVPAAIGPVAALVLAAGLGLAAPGAPSGVADLDSATLGGLEARAIGPAVMSGRVAAIDAARMGGTIHLYVGAASGGVWKSVDGGVSFEPVFDDHVQSIGAVEIDPSDPETVWAGTGESWVRNSVSIGRGVFKSTDGGDEWTLMGLGDTERIARIRIHPQDGDTVWVCATGHLWNGNEQRGVFKTTDGGRTWKKVLYVDEDTGCADIDIDPQAPDIVYAALWQFRRYPDRFVSGGPGSGLYKSTDGGETWNELTNGLPEGEKGRIAVAVAPSRPNRLYATVEAEETALYRSDDLGSSWERINDSSSVSARPFYFSHLVVDPKDHRTVYKPGQFLAISTDGGESFTSFLAGAGSVHADHHALWIDPQDPKHLVLGTDGGVYVSHDQGHTFRMVASLPISQFYEVSADMEWPYNVYGGLQDNGSWMGPSRSPSGIENKDWENVGFGDGFHTYRDPADPDFVYSEYQGGQIHRLHLPTGEVREIKPYPAEGEPEYRFNWNTPVAFSPHGRADGRAAVYLGAQRLLRSDDHGSSWRPISPDLTTDDPEWQRQEESGGLSIDNSTAENHTTIYTISESPVEEGVIWVGTDDGNVQVTRDGGESWTLVSEDLPGELPERTWISEVFASPHAAGTAFVTVDGHYVGDMSTHVYRTTDYGATWTSLAKEPLEGFAHAIEQDPVNPDLLFLGTELGLWITLDGGERWVRFEGGLPDMVPVRDVAIHPRDGDLVIGTHGRGIWILDDLTPLRNLTSEVLEQDVALLPTRDAVMVIPAPQQQFGGQEQFVGLNPPEAAGIAYYMARRHLFGDLRVEIYDAGGELIKTVPGSKRRGVNRVTWPMRLPPPKVPPATNLVPAFEGPRVLEGTYTVKLVKGDETVTGEIELVPDPRSPHSEEDRRLQQTTALELYGMLERLTYLIDGTVDLRDQARARAESLAERNRTRRQLEEYADALESLRAGLVSTSESGMLSGDEKLREDLGSLYGGVNGYTGRPTDSQLDRVEMLSGRLDDAFRSFEELADRRGELERTLQREGLEPLDLLTREEWQERDD
jgi:photosystem II stability/assembly factor-like uncharacterized protein